MNDDEYPVYPNLKKTINIVKFKFNILEIILFKSVRVAVYLFNENDLLIESRQYLFQDSEYNAWSNDDKYIINLIKQKLQQN